MVETADAAAKELHDQLPRTIHVVNVDEYLVNEIELYVEHARHGGGEYEKCEYSKEHRNLTVIFVDAEGLQQHLISNCFCKWNELGHLK